MESKQINDETVLIPKTNSKGKAVAVAVADADGSRPVVVTTAKTTTPQGGRWKKGLAIFDFVLRLCAAAAAFAAASTMGYAEQTLPFFTQFLQFHAEYTDVPTFPYFVIANAVAGGYLVLSLPFSIVCIVRPHAIGPRLFLAVLDTVMIALVISGAAAATAILYLAHNGNVDANWIAICQQFTDFCQQASGSVVASFIASVIFMFLVVNSALALKRS